MARLGSFEVTGLSSFFFHKFVAIDEESDGVHATHILFMSYDGCFFERALEFSNISIRCFEGGRNVLRRIT
jgi:hypothetical protein